MAVPSELEQHRYQKQKDTGLTWYQEIYNKYGYEPKVKHPTFFGPYLLLQTLGEGEFAKVKTAVHIHTNQEVQGKKVKSHDVVYP
jgi:serine/threonine protein kinase